MLCDVMIFLVVGAVVIWAPSGQALTQEEKKTNFVQLLRKVENDLCSTLMSTRLNTQQRADAIINGSKYCVDLRGLLRDSPDYEQGDCMNASEPACGEVKDSYWSSKRLRCTVKVPGLHYGFNRISIYSCVEKALKEYKRQIKNGYCKSNRYDGGGQVGSGSFKVHYGPPPAQYRPSQAAAPAPQNNRGRRREPSTSPPPSARTTTTTSTTRPHPPRGPQPPVSVTVNPYSDKKYGTGTITESTYEKGEASGGSNAKKSSSWSWRKMGSVKQKPVKIK